jgi:hypothetical protein
MSRFEPVLDVIDSLCLRSGDTLRRKKGLYLSVAKDVWNDLNETTLRITERVKIPIRKEYRINKRTNSIDLDCKFNRLSSVNIEYCGLQYPIYRNLEINDDIVDLGAVKDCACEYNCGFNLCNTIKGYEAIQSVMTDNNPDGSVATFNCISRIAVGNNGVVYQEKQYPKRIYTNGVWTSTILYTENTEMCQCEVDDNGCLCDTPQNINSVCNSCGIKGFVNNINPCAPGPCIGGTASCPPQPGCDEWIYYCDNKMDWFSVQCGCFPGGFGRGRSNTYNIGATGSRLVFPTDFGFEKVIVRFYKDIDLNDLQIPYFAKQTFMSGMQAFAFEYNPVDFKMSENMAGKYSRQKWGLYLELQRMRIKELGITIAPASMVPSYMDHREDRWIGYY